jgi:hypothetical protein
VQVSDPQRDQRFMQLEQYVQNYRNGLLAPGGRLINANGIVVIPVVVHILHNGEPLGTGRNISVAQIQSQMDVLNEDFNRLNADQVNAPAVFAVVAAGI